MTDRTQPARWYMIDKDGMATLCTDMDDAEQEAKDADMAWPHKAPHRAVQLVEASFDSADMATAAAQGFRDGVASVAAGAGSELVAYAIFSANGNIRLWSKARIPHPDAKPLYLHPSPPEGMVGGLQDIASAPKDGTRILLHPAVEVHDSWSKGYWSEQHECWIVGGSASGVAHIY